MQHNIQVVKQNIVNKVVSPYQVGFIAGISIQNNIIMAQETLYIMNKLQWKHGKFVMKINLEKAYDMMSWSYVHKVLLEIGIIDKIIKVIMESLTTVIMIVLWKGKKDSNFDTHKGLRRGDPISPLIFILCMKRLTHLIIDKVQKGNWDCITVGRKWPRISHLMFTDDLFLFGKATVKQM